MIIATATSLVVASYLFVFVLGAIAWALVVRRNPVAQVDADKLATAVAAKLNKPKS